ncbi:MAG: pyridine nucleotide-disulfide oxidoreductase, partial [Burkholderiales bacterium]|nr:pyridine nucleotide-disulfide oxidoreductase [Burkholderiales bacterium]
VLLNQNGRLIDSEGRAITGMYVTGWIKRGASGVIGTNRADSVHTVSSLLSDVTMLDSSMKLGAEGLRGRLKQRAKRFVNFQQWLAIDAAEVRKGALLSKPREKYCRVDDMLDVVKEEASSI